MRCLKHAGVVSETTLDITADLPLPGAFYQHPAHEPIRVGRPPEAGCSLERGIVMGDGCLGGVDTGGGFRGALPVLEALTFVARFTEVMSELLRVVLQPLGVECLERVACPQVQSGASRRR